MGMPMPVYHTAAMVLAMPEDGQRYETVHGELLVSAAPRPLHQLVRLRLLRALDEYLVRHREVGVVFGGGDISWAEDTLVIPDLFVVDRPEAETMAWDRMKTLHLVVEVISPSTARQDRFTKRRLYQEVGVPIYWLVDADAGQVDIWTPDALFPTTEQQELRWHPAGAAEPLVIALPELFAPV